MQARAKAVVWDPKGSNKFVIGGGNELRLYAWEHSKTESRVTTRSVVSELGQLRTFAWSPHHSIPDLMALGLTTGRTLLLRMDASASPSVLQHYQDIGIPPKLSAVQINVRHSRPCNVVAFSNEVPELLAIGLEKARGESLLLFDIEHSARSLDGGKEASGGMNATVPIGSTNRAKPTPVSTNPSRSTTRQPSPISTPHPNAPEPHPLLQLGSSETVTSVTFLSGGTPNATSPILVASMGGKWLRSYDIRSPPTSIASWGSRSIFGLSSNPFNGYQFASHGDDGVVKLWDLRKSADALLSFSDIDAGSNPHHQSNSNKARQNYSARPLTELAWSPHRRGILSTLEREGQAIRVWNIAEGPKAVLDASVGVSVGGQEMSNGDQLPVGSKRSAEPSPSSTTFGDPLRLPVLLSDRRSKSFSLPIVSFAFASSPSLDPTSPQTHFIGVSRDTSNPGSSGHRIEIIPLDSPLHCGFLERSIVVPSSSSTTSSSEFNTYSLSPFPTPSDNNNNEVDSTPPPSPTIAAGRPPLDRGRSLSLSSLYPQQEDRNDTPRPGGVSSNVRRMSRARVNTIGGGEDEGFDQGGEGEGERVGVAGLKVLGSDASVVLRDRVERGYGSNALVNASLVQSSLADFWGWIARAESLSQDACVLDYDFRFRGALPILLGFPSNSSSTNSNSSSSTSTSKTPSPSHRPTSIYNDIHRSLRKGDEARQKDAAYAAAASALVSKRKLDGTFAISSSQFGAQRKLALQSCGADWEADWESVCERFERDGNYEAAARHAFFSGHLEKAMQRLKLCSDERLRVLAPVLAAYIAQKDSQKGTDSVYAELCRSLSSDGDTPWIRAMFAFLASGEWRELVEETALPLKDRVAVALRFLPDSELLPFLQNLGHEAQSSGDLEAVVLFGLRDAGLQLLSNYINRTADVQTVALACTFVSPGLIRNDRRVDRWIASYRTTLDAMRLYTPRVLLDTAQGRRARAFAEKARLEGRHSEANNVAMALKRAAPPQLVVRCQFCSANIVPPAGYDRGTRPGIVGPIGVKSTLCPTCSKTLPSCCICLERPSIHTVTDGSSNLVWCMKCRHGGHTGHVLEWLRRSNGICAVSNCDCNCQP